MIIRSAKSAVEYRRRLIRPAKYAVEYRRRLIRVAKYAVEYRRRFILTENSHSFLLEGLFTDDGLIFAVKLLLLLLGQIDGCFFLHDLANRFAVGAPRLAWHVPPPFILLGLNRCIVIHIAVVGLDDRILAQDCVDGVVEHFLFLLGPLGLCYLHEYLIVGLVSVNLGDHLFDFEH